MNCREGCSPPGTGGVAAPVRKRREASEPAQTGWSLTVHVDVVTLSGTDHPVCALIRRLRSIFFMAQPPLLSEEGNTLSCNSFTPSMSAGFFWNQRNTGGHRPPLQ